MTLSEQLMWGTIFLTVCIVFHTVFIAYFTKFILRFGSNLKNGLAEQIARLAAAIVIIVTSHTVQVWTWATALLHYNIFTDWNTSIYFSLVTYTALGYGDITLDEGARIFAAFASVTGLLGFGVSTAFVAALLSKLFRRVETRD